MKTESNRLSSISPWIHWTLLPRKIVSVVCLASLLFAVPMPGLAQDSAPKPADEKSDVVTTTARNYKLFLGPNHVPLEMQKDPVLHWLNSTRSAPDGATYIWTKEGRPEAIACIWMQGSLGSAFHSLSTDSLVAEYKGKVVWQPKGNAIELKKFAEAPLPADSPANRLRQMKDLARRFQCRLISGANKTEDLRLLPTPLYRYKTDRTDLFDGALFAFVQGTDPEVILMLEAHRSQDETVWKYLITRRSGYPLEADLDGQRVWNVPAANGLPGEPWFQTGVPQ